VTGKLVRLACERSLRDHRGAAAERGLHFDAEAAEHVLDFFGFLKHSKGEWAGREFILEPWQEFIVWEVFGWYRADGSRRFRVVHAEVAKKNGKTTLLAGIALYLLDGDGEPGAEVYSAATKRDQAAIMHEEAIRMVLNSPDLRRQFQVFRRNISRDATASKFEPLSSDFSTLDGLNIHGGLVDELHAHPSGALYEVLETSTGARRSPLIFSITTAGDDQTSFCYARREYAVAVLEELFADDTLFAYISTLDQGDDWREESLWIKANPNLGVSVKVAPLRDQIEMASRSPRQENDIRRFRLNEWTSATTRWLSLDEWDACAGELLPGQIEIEREGAPCYGGLDLASTSDIAAFVLLFPPMEGGDFWDVVCRFWIPGGDLAERVKKTKIPYGDWIRDGWLLSTPGDVTDYRLIRLEIEALSERYQILEIPYDKWNATETSSELQDKGFPMVSHKQGYPDMSPPMKELERLLKCGRLRHGGHPVLRWMASNIECKQFSGAIKPVKPDHKAATKKIDGMVALIMALSRATAPPEEEESSPYEEHGVRVL
jgi:phage terminase large subunit-like protein